MTIIISGVGVREEKLEKQTLRDRGEEGLLTKFVGSDKGEGTLKY